MDDFLALIESVRRRRDAVLPLLSDDVACEGCGKTSRQCASDRFEWEIAELERLAAERRGGLKTAR